MNFMMRLLESNGFNTILNMIDRLIKKRYYIAYITINKNIIAKNTARILYKNVDCIIIRFGPILIYIRPNHPIFNFKI